MPSRSKTPRPLTAERQAFVLAFIETGNASEAYRRAYPRSRNWTPNALHARASRLLAEPEISDKVRDRANDKARDKVEAIAAGKVAPLVDQVRQAHAARHQLTVDDIIDRLEELRLLAIKNNQVSAGVSATAELRKLLFGDKTVHELRDRDGNLVDVDALVRALMRRRSQDGEIIDAETLPAPEPASKAVKHLPFPGKRSR
jgi:hypothetical protein